jgi:hypothetical protein
MHFQNVYFRYNFKKSGLHQDNLGRLYKVFDADADATICSFGGMFSVETLPSQNFI